MDVIDKIKDQIGTNPVLLYMKGTPDFPQCGFSAQAVAALRACGADFAFVNIFEEPEMREALKCTPTGQPIPQLYVEGELIGGSDIIAWRCIRTANWLSCRKRCWRRMPAA